MMSRADHISDRILRQAVKQRDRLLQDLVEFEMFIRTFERLAASKDEETANPAPAKAEERPKQDSSLIFPPLGTLVAKRKIKSSRKREVERVVREVLEECGQPVTSAEMLKLVTERGITIGGREPRWNLSAKLSRMTDVVSLDDGSGWWFKDRPSKSSKYILNSESEGPDDS